MLYEALKSSGSSRLDISALGDEVGLFVVERISKTLSRALEFAPYGNSPRATLRELFAARFGYEGSSWNYVEGLSQFGIYYKGAIKAQDLLINGYERREETIQTVLRDRQLGVYREALIADGNEIGSNVFECMFQQFLANIDSGFHRGLETLTATGRNELREGFNIGWEIFHKAKDMVTQIQTGQRYYSI